MPNLLSCFLFTVKCQLAVFRLLSVCVLAGGGWRDWRVLCGLAWRGRLGCDCVWDVVMGDRHVDVWVLLDGAWGQPSIYFPIGDHVNVSWCCSHTNASGVISTSHIVASHITKLLLSFRQILQFRF